MANEIREGKISSVNHAAGTVRVVYHQQDDAVTRDIPMLSPVATGAYCMPEVGDQVLVLHLSDGTEAAVVLGRPWSDKNKPQEGAAGLFRLDMDRTPGVAMIRYKGGTVTIKAGAVQVSGKLSTTAGAEIGGDLTVDGDLTINGNLTVSGNIDAAEVAASGDVTAGGVSLKNHTHDCACALSSGTTSPPK